MRLHRFIANHNVTLAVLIAIMMRASVAKGFMLEIPAGNGFALPVLAVCPQQSPGLAAWLDAGPAEHAHHQHRDGGSQSELSLTVADPACALWAGSSLASAHGNVTVPGVVPGSTAPAGAQKPAPERVFPSAHRARGPPLLLSV